MQMLRFPEIAEAEFSGCLTAFVDALWAALEGVTLSLDRLRDRSKGSAFLFEMQMDQHRYGVLLVLERWTRLVDRFGAAAPAAAEDAVAHAAARSATAAGLMEKLNHLIDGSERYSAEIAAAAAMTFGAIRSEFAAEHLLADRNEKLGPMLPEEYQRAKAVFRSDLLAR